MLPMVVIDHTYFYIRKYFTTSEPLPDLVYISCVRKGKANWTREIAKTIFFHDYNLCGAKTAETHMSFAWKYDFPDIK